MFDLTFSWKVNDWKVKISQDKNDDDDDNLLMSTTHLHVNGVTENRCDWLWHLYLLWHFGRSFHIYTVIRKYYLVLYVCCGTTTHFCPILMLRRYLKCKVLLYHRFPCSQWGAPFVLIFFHATCCFLAHVTGLIIDNLARSVFSHTSATWWRWTIWFLPSHAMAMERYCYRAASVRLSVRLWR